MFHDTTKPAAVSDNTVSHCDCSFKRLSFSEHRSKADTLDKEQSPGVIET